MNKNIESRRPRVVYAFPTSHHFRVSFHEKLRVSLNDLGIDYEYVYASNADHQFKNDITVIDWATNIPLFRMCIFGRELIWQQIIRNFLDSDLFIIQQENRHIANYIILILAALLGKRVAYFGHGRNFQARFPNGPAEIWKRFWATKVYWWFAYTDKTAQLLTKQGFPQDRITVFNNAIDTVAIQMQLSNLEEKQITLLRNTLVKGSENVGVYVGGIYREKRISFLLDAARVVRSKVPDFHLIIIGSGAEENLLRNLPENWIHYMGARFGADKTELVALAKVFLMPGLVGLSVLDSFAYGAPMVTCELSYHSPEIAYLENGINGVILEDAKDQYAYAEAVIRILTDENWRKSLQTGARENKERYTIDNMVAHFTKGVTDVLK